MFKYSNNVRKWNYKYAKAYSNVWAFLQKIHQDALLHKFNALQAVTGHQKKPRRNYQRLDGRVQTLIDSYDEKKKNITLFLSGITYLQ